MLQDVQAGRVPETVQFGALQMTPRICFTRPPTESPNTTSFVEAPRRGKPYCTVGADGRPAIDGMIDLCGPIDHVFCQSFRQAVEIDPRFDQLRKLSDINRLLTYSTSLSQVAQLAVERGTELLDATAAALVASLRPRRLDFFTEPLPVAAGWPDAPCGYLRLSAAYDTWLERARALTWPTASLDAGHFHALVDPGGLAGALLALLARMEARGG